MHKSVLLQTSIEKLEIKNGDIFVDGTLGSGGHTAKVMEQFGNRITYVGIDMDQDAIDRSKKIIDLIAEKSGSNITYILGNYRNMDTLLEQHGVHHVDKILLDIGLSSNQFEESKRGFSFQRDEPLLMTFKKDISEAELSAREIVNTWDEENLQAIIEGYGEERFAAKITRAICRYRTMKSIETTGELVDIIYGATPKFYHHRKIHPATKTFQALRIVVNDEIENLRNGIINGWKILNPHGRIAIISFHSLEDRIVKNYFKKYEEDGIGLKITKKPIVAEDLETDENPRARSAKLRVIEKIHD